MYQLYANLHGYAYVRVVVPRPPGNFPMTYWKGRIAQRYLHEYDLLVLVDMDTAPMDINLPLGCVLDAHNYTWNHPAPIAMPEDPAGWLGEWGWRGTGGARRGVGWGGVRRSGGWRRARVWGVVGVQGRAVWSC